ncbi:alkaline phosphatase family protein [Bifidobacterium xylocopae]|uniref:Nucleotide pyrophosphatase n=1 Tax=Bifidobacterium xylocopae TaxID=2493119 RepID=A0A366KFS8_9BIFI|nr:alkaline phosphatase family protein [Bifidobacterium xylocopae]RBP99551.1 nucleotide pyrophosphatase [Bifidobacterium xylocopae]
MADLPSMDELTRLAPDITYGDRVGPDAGRGQALHLSAVLPALSAALGHPTPTAVHPDPDGLQAALGLPDVRSAVVVVVDGLGYWNLKRRLGHTPYLRSLLSESSNDRPICTCLPSTTTAAMAVFGTGGCPGLTGMAGYTQLNPYTGGLSQLIQFRDAPEPEDLQRQPTVFELLQAQEVRVTSSGLPNFADSGLTRAALRGSDYIGGLTPAQRIAAAAEAAREPGLTYLYIRDVDKTGHADGWEGEQWVASLEKVDGQLALLHRSVPKGTLILIVADHGMVAADPDRRFDLAGHRELQTGIGLVGGEPRQVMLYLDEGVDPQAAAGKWQEELGGNALVRTKAQAIRSGLFGPVDDRVAPIFGDILISCQGGATLVDTRSQSEPATRMPGVHGSQTYLETDIPCLSDLV